MVRASLRLGAHIEPIDVEAAIRALINRHEALRTTFDQIDGHLVQVVHHPSNMAAPLPCTDLQEMPVEARPSAARRLADGLADQPFDLRLGPLVRSHLLRSSGRASVLLLAFHHIVVDGWSIQVIHDDLTALLQKRELSAQRVQYADFTGWRRRATDEADLDWWRRLHAGLPDQPPLFGAGAEDGPETGTRLTRSLPPPMVASLRRAAATHGSSPFAILLAAWATAVAEHTGRRDLVIGCPAAGRTHVDLERVVGFLVNTLPLRVRLGSLTFGELVAQVRDVGLEAFARQHVPYEEIVRALPANRDGRRLFDVMFNYLGGKALPRASPGSVNGNGSAPAAVGAHAALELYVLDFGDAVRLELITVDGQVSKAMACGLLDRTCALLDLGSHPVADRPLPAPGPAATGGQGGTLVDRLVSIMEAHAGRLAIDDGRVAWSYAELRRQSLKLAASVAASGAPRIGLVGSHDAHAVAGIVGILLAGAAYVPLDPRWPVARLAEIIDDAELTTLMIDLRQSGLVDELRSLRPGLAWLNLMDCDDPELPATAPTTIGLAYLIYTSGSTGKPKGVMQSHDNLLGNACTYADSIRLSAEDRLSLLAGVGTDAAVMDLFGALLSGACLVPIDLGPGGTGTVPFDELPAVLAERRVTVLHSTPSVFRQLVLGLDGLQSGQGKSSLPAVRTVVLGGEPAARADLLAFQRCFGPEAVLVNGFGPTEATMALQFTARHDTIVVGDVLPLGTPVRGMTVSVESPEGTPVGVGDVGEIVLAGPHLALGYWRRPDETARAFAGGRYRTGDLACVQPDQTLFFAGRADDQLKLRGFRIEPTEIEAALRKQPGMIEAAVTADLTLTAHLVVAPGAGLTPARVRRALRRLLPDVMVPSRFLTHPKLPLTNSGKIDRRAVAQLPGRPLREERPSPPRRGREQVVAEIWAEVLGVDESEIGPADTFADLGGHSLLITQMSARLADQFGIRLPLRRLFERPSLRDLSALIDAMGDQEVGSATDGRIRPRGAPGPFPLSSAQSRLWFIDRLNPGLATYTMTTMIPVQDGTSAWQVRSALDQLVRRHESLRTTFSAVEGRPMQHVSPHLDVPLAVTAASGGTAAEVRRHVGLELAATVFDLGSQPLVRAHYVDGGADGGSVLYLALHHIIADGWSLSLLRRELTLLLTASREGRPLPLPELPLQYVDYALWECDHLRELTGGAEWWADALAGAPERIDLPTDRPRPANPSFRGDLMVEPLPGDVVAGVQEMARESGLTPFAVYLAAFAAVLHRWSGQEDLVIGTPVAGRTRIETEQIVGLFVNSLPLRLRPRGDLSFDEFLASVGAISIAAQEHQDVPLAEIVRRVAPQRRLAYAPLFQVMFALGSAREGGPIEEVAHTATAKFDLGLTVDDGAVSAIYLEYASDLYDGQTARCLLRAMIAVLRGSFSDPRITMDRLPLGEPWRPTGPSLALPPVPAGGADGARLAVAGRSPETFDELDKLTRALQARIPADLPRGSVIAIDLPRSAELIAALLAVRASGHAFVLLDATWPAMRRRDLLARSGTAFLLGPDERLDTRSTPVPNLAGGYLVATSGSTGRPKIIEVSGAALDSQIAVLAGAYALSSADRVLQFASVGFDVAIEEILPTLAAGGTVDLAHADLSPTFPELDELCAPGGVTVLNLPATYWHEWVRYLTEQGQGVPAGLRLVITGSEPVAPGVVAQWQALPRRCRLLVAYGTSETGITNSLYEPDPSRDWSRENRVPIGQPLPTGRLLVVDADGRELPRGALGELAVEGECLALGYRDEPMLASRRFVAGPSGRRYLTGDRGRWRFDGQLEVVGRIDGQLKLSGHRIEPAEVEAALLRQPGVAAAAVTVRPALDGRPRLVAYLVPAGGSLDTEQLRGRLSKELPDYLVPSAYAVLDALPRGSSGKLDRSLLPAVIEPPTPSPGPPPSGPLERLVAEVWARVLDLPIDAISATSNFFDLGGDSILSLQVAWRLREHGLAASLAQLFDHQTVRDLAAALAAKDAPAHPDQPAEAMAEAVPLSPIQHWQLDRASSSPEHDNQAVLLTVDETVEASALRGALAAVVAAHDALRLRFARDGDYWRARIADGADGPTLHVHEAGAELRTVAARSHASLDLGQGPLFRGDFLLGPRHLLLVAHHLVVDVVSWRIIREDLELALHQIAAGEPIRLRTEQAGWATWVRRLTDWAQGEKASEQARWWVKSADRGPVIVVPDLRSGAASDEQTLTVALTGRETAALQQSLAAVGARVEDSLLTALAMALAEQSGRENPVRQVRIDSEGHGREPLFGDLDVARTVGWFTSLRPVTIQLASGQSPGEVLVATARMMRTMPRHGVAHGAVRHLRPAGDPVAAVLRGQAQAQVAVNYLGRLDSRQDRWLEGRALLRSAGPAPGPARAPSTPRPYPVDVVAGLRDSALVVWLNHHGADRELARRLAFRCRGVLRELATGLGQLVRRPLTPMQEAMLYSPQAARGTGAYIEHAVLDLPSGTDHQELRSAWETAIRRHEILRARFVEEPDGGRYQEVQPEVRLPWRTVDWRHLAPAEGDRQLAGLLEDDRQRGFVPDEAPLLRLILVRLADGDRLVWSHHHALLDGWSAAALLDEVGGRRRPQEAAPPFGDYLDWLGDRDQAADQAYWTAALAGRPEPTLLPRHRPGPGQPQARALGLALPPAELAALDARARASRVGSAVLAHAAWALVQAEYLGSDDVTFGVTSSGRPPDLPGADRMIGLFITTHPARVWIQDDKPLREWLAELARQELHNRQHAYAALPAIARWAAIAPGAPLFEVVLVVENYRRGVGRTPGGAPGAVREMPLREASDVPLSVVFAPDSGLSMVYDARRFSGEWIADLLQALRRTLAAIAAAGPAATVADVRVLPALARSRVEMWNDTKRPQPATSLGAQWRAAAVRHAASVAVSEPGGRSVTYAELAAAADRVTASLLEAGAWAGNPVAVMGQRSAALAAAVLGIVQAGCAYVPLDPAYPDERLRGMIEGASVRLALAEPALLGRLPETLIKLPFPGWQARADGRGSTGGDPEPSAEASAYIIYTSGSTGQPKGVVVPHRAVTRLVINTDYCQLGPGDAVALASTCAFDASTFEIWGALLNGARLVPVDADTLLAPARLAALLRDQRVTTMFLTTAAFNMVAAQRPDAFAPLSTLLFGGERVDPRAVRRVLDAGPPRRLLHVYGPTEATTFASWQLVTSVPAEASTVPIGRPIANTELLVLDPAGALVPAGLEGELCIGGPGLALGYLNDDQLTAQRFVAHPWRPGERLYRTGDVVLQGSDGMIEIRGRVDEQVKIRGFRIEPGEVQSRLLEAPGVAAAVVVPRRETAEVHYLCAYVVPEPGARLEPGDLKSFLRQRLPEYLVPSAIMVMDALPLSPNGKVDRTRLPDPRRSEPGADLPSTTAEKAVARIWSAVLGIDASALSRDQDFFDLGGHSLLLTQVASRLRSELGVEVPLRSLFEIRTVDGLASLVARSERAVGLPIPLVDREAHAASIDDHGQLIVSNELRERLAQWGG